MYAFASSAAFFHFASVQAGHSGLLPFVNPSSLRSLSKSRWPYDQCASNSRLVKSWVMADMLSLSLKPKQVDKAVSFRSSVFDCELC